ncbi:MAG: TRAP transporter large permease [Henriciella sp.]
MIVALLICLLLLVLLRTPVVLAIGLVGLAGMIMSVNATPAFFAQRSFAVIDSFSLLALPYFILAGSIMARGGLSTALVTLFQSVFGRVRGSLGHATVGACVGMANVSGSSAAEAAAIGSVTIPAMKESGYPPGLAASIVAASATIGPVIPPSMTMIIFGSMSGVSIGGLFMAGIIPGLIMAMALGICIWGLSFRRGYDGLKAFDVQVGAAAFVRAFRKSLVALVAPVIILGGIFAGVFTATEAGIVACVYAFLTSWLYYRSIAIADMKAIILDAAITTSVVVGIISMAGSLGWLMSFEQFNAEVLACIQSLSSNGVIVLFLLVGAMLLLTMFLESLAVLIVFIPTIALITTAYGFDPLHVGVVVVIATQLGALSPPVALLLFITTKIADAPIVETFKHVVPFLAALLIVLVVLILNPQIVTWLPELARGPS